MLFIIRTVVFCVERHYLLNIMQKVVLFDYLCKANIEKPPIRMRYNPILLIMAAALCLLSCKTNSVYTIYQFSALSNKGQEVNFADYKGKVVGRFEPTTEPAQLGQPIEEQLK